MENILIAASPIGIAENGLSELRWRTTDVVTAEVQSLRYFETYDDGVAVEVTVRYVQRAAPAPEAVEDKE